MAKELIKRIIEQYKNNSAMASHPEENELLLLPSLCAQLGENGVLILTRKFINGVDEFNKNWPGSVRVLVNINQEPTSDLDHIKVIPGRSKYPIEIRPASKQDLENRLRKSSAVLAFLSPYELETAKFCSQNSIPLFFVSEYTLKTEFQIIDAGTRNPILRWRRKLWAKLAEKKKLTALKLATGLQCSGTPTFEAYREKISNTLLFFDNRVPLSSIITPAQIHSKFKNMIKPIRLVFGGRLISMKGVIDLPFLALELKKNGVPFKLDIYGDGELKSKLASYIRKYELEEEVKLCGTVDFETQWIPILKQKTDLFVCCHPQGDPSSTYPEVMSCGVPIVGYDNEAFTGIVTYSDSGWLCNINDTVEMAKIISRLSKNRKEIMHSALKARSFACANSFEATFKARIKQITEAPPKNKSI